MKTFWENKRVLITGGSQGLGRALAIAASKQGAKVAVSGRDKERLRALQNDFGFETIVADLSDPKVPRLVQMETASRLGGIDILINNASSLGETPLRPLLDTDPSVFAEVQQTNLLSVFQLIRTILPEMLLRDQGLIVNVSSDAAVVPYETWGAYSVSKAGLDHLTKIWDTETPKTIRFFSVDPGEMNTQMHREAIPDADPETLLSPEGVAVELLRFLEIADELSESHVRFSANEWRERNVFHTTS